MPNDHDVYVLLFLDDVNSGQKRESLTTHTSCARANLMTKTCSDIKFHTNLIGTIVIELCEFKKEEEEEEEESTIPCDDVSM